ncbi:uncharacterized protein FOMMEDRAFT_137182 [Fomitiporia mediterranea MF3/22]|uniref:uncharacterized protein n=1 Tax=Fomitiporia mediterranea (strain MF3/22) TaxID=694068 RepID=UPI000440935A|nr:uncharacterized protein FOMMEDRAFT_137182 [Fomitiporia mediterranea MF3/22]EJC98276.1 hypothetical protein FOMMEDRAFT_137182 [Fomitiporia mediterranea MF3/22]
MTDTQDKGTGPTAVDQQQQQNNQPPMYALQQPSQYTVGYPPLYPYPPPPQDANGHPTDPNAAPGAYMMAFPPPPPGMIYAYPTPQGYAGMPFAPGMPLPAALVRPKRKQVKMACTNCAAACKRCDAGRPCERCCKYGISDSCIDGQRKERKKGIKRGPYKRKGKVAADTGYEGFTPEQTSAEGFYQPYFYPPPGFVAVGPDGQPVQGDPSGAQQGMQPQYYSLQPYPPFAFPHGAAGGYPVMPGHMMPPPGSSGTETDGESAPAGPPPPTTAATSEGDGGNSINDTQTDDRGKKRKSGTTSAANGKDDHGSAKRTGKRVAANVVENAAAGSSLAGVTGV